MNKIIDSIELKRIYKILIIVKVLIVVIIIIVFDFYSIPTPSSEGTLLVGDRVIGVNFVDIKRNDITYFNYLLILFEYTVCLILYNWSMIYF